MKVTMKVEGLKELDAALGELPKATARNTLRRVLLKAGAPMAAHAKSVAPDDPGTGGNDLRSSIAVSTKLSKRQKGQHWKSQKDAGEKNFAEVFVGAGPVPHAHMQEFGTSNHGPQAFMRPAFDANRNKAVDIIKSELGAEIDKAAKRLARKAARIAAKAK